jgi:hypothetical protein
MFSASPRCRFAVAVTRAAAVADPAVEVIATDVRVTP